MSSSVFMLLSVRFVEENTKHMEKETGNISNTDVTTLKKKVLQDLSINNGGGFVNSWVDSMRACSPTHLKSLMKQSSWLVRISFSDHHDFISAYLLSYNRRGLYNFCRQSIHQL